MVSTRLREESKEAHMQLEKQVVKVLKNISTSEDYIAMLQKFYNYFSNVEKAIAPYITADLLPDYPQRRNSSYLKRDIIALGGHIDDSVSVSIPSINSTLQAFGALYVMEGSIMGGRVIVQILEKHGITQGISFFSGYGDNTMKMWSAFTDVINNLAATEQEESVIVKTTQETFSHFGKLFENNIVAA